MHEDARMVAEQIVEGLGAVDGAHNITLDYYRTQADLDEAQIGSGTDEPVGYVNARTRLVGQLLDREEIAYTYRYA